MRTTIAGVGNPRMTVAISVSKIDSVSAIKVAGRFTDVVLADADRWILRAGATGHVVLCPGEAIVGRHRNATTTAVCCARRVRHIDSAIGCDLNVAMDATRAYSGVKNRYTRAEGLSAVIAARALRLRDDIL